VWAARSLGLPTSSDFRTNFHQYSRYYGLSRGAGRVFSAQRRLHNATDCTFVPTPELRVELAAQGFRRLSVVGRGVDGARFSPTHRCAALRASWGAGEADTVLLHVGRLAPEKNVGLALRCFGQLRREHAGLHMVVVGAGPSQAALQAACPEARFVGMKVGDELAMYYASADLFVFPSLSETFGNVALEALASGLPVLAFRRGAAAQHVRDGLEGFLVEPGDEDGFIAAAARFVASSTDRAAMRMLAHTAGQRAQWQDVLAGFEQRLEDVIRRKSEGIVAWACHD
jgi:glycosyltransferase involved in cell wall biosynthesis